MADGYGLLLGLLLVPPTLPGGLVLLQLTCLWGVGYRSVVCIKKISLLYFSRHYTPHPPSSRDWIECRSYFVRSRKSRELLTKDDRQVSTQSGTARCEQRQRHCARWWSTWPTHLTWWLTHVRDDPRTWYEDPPRPTHVMWRSHMLDYDPCIRDERICEKESEQIFEYIRKTETSLNEYANILERLKSSRTNIQIYMRPKFEQIFKYIRAQSKKHGKYALKRWHYGKNRNKTENKYSLIYFDHTANIRIYSNINNVRIQIKIFIRGQKYSNIFAHPCHACDMMTYSCDMIHVC